MTVKELIEALKKMPQGMDVCVQNGLDPSDWTIAGTVEIKTVEALTTNNYSSRPSVVIE